MRQTAVSATASAPGSIGNVGPGLDILGLALSGPRDSVTVSWAAGPSDLVDDPGHPDLPADPRRNTAAVAARAVLDYAGLARSVRVTVRKGLPLSGGQGGSAASAVAGAVAAARLAGLDLRAEELLRCAVEGEAVASGRQADNLAPSLLGGFVLVRGVDPVELVSLPVPPGLWVVLAHPDQRLETRLARAALPDMVARATALAQAAAVATMVAGACRGDIGLLGAGVTDHIAEPARTHLLPGFDAAKRAALDAGAAGCSISGAGPTSFALASNRMIADRVAAAMAEAYRGAGVRATSSVTTVDLEGALG